MFSDSSMSYKIGDYNRNLFFAGNAQTVGNFPGFKLNNQYRVYIEYFNASNVRLNAPVGQTEMSLLASPMIQASEPPNVRECDFLDTWSTQCRSLAPISFGFRIIWDRAT